MRSYLLKRMAWGVWYSEVAVDRQVGERWPKVGNDNRRVSSGSGSLWIWTGKRLSEEAFVRSFSTQGSSLRGLRSIKRAGKATAAYLKDLTKGNSAAPGKEDNEPGTENTKEEERERRWIFFHFAFPPPSMAPKEESTLFCFISLPRGSLNWQTRKGPQAQHWDSFQCFCDGLEKKMQKYRPNDSYLI